MDLVDGLNVKPSYRTDRSTLVSFRFERLNTVELESLFRLRKRSAAVSDLRFGLVCILVAEGSHDSI